MKLFTVHHVETEESLCIAARNTDHAAQVFVTFILAHTGTAPGEFYVERGVPPEYRNNVVVESVTQRKLAGVIVLQPNGLMLFDPVIGE